MLEPRQIIAGITNSLMRRVLPELGAGYARGQLYAVIELLENLEGRVDWGGLAFNAEAGMLADLAAEMAAPLAEAGFDDLAARARAYAGSGGGVQALPEGRALVCEAIECGAADASPIKELIDGYIVNDAVTKGLTLRPSRLAEISQG